MNSDGAGNNFLHLNDASASGGGNDTSHYLAPAVSRSQQLREIRFQQCLRLDEMLMEQFRLKQMRHQQQRQQGNSFGGQNGGDVGHYEGMRQSQPPTTMVATMNDDGASLRSPESMMPSFNNNNSFHLQNSIHPKRVQSPSRTGRQQQDHRQLTRSLPIMPNNDNNTRFFQSTTQFQGHQILEDLRAHIHRQSLQLQQLQQQIDDSSSSSSSFQPASFFPSQQQRLKQQQQQNELTHSFQGISSNVNSSSKVNKNDGAGMTKASSSTASQSLFHHEDALGFCRDFNTNGYGGDKSSNNNINSMNPPPIGWQQQQMSTIINNNTTRLSTIINNNLAQTSPSTPLSPSTNTLPSSSEDSNQMKRRRLNSDQMLQMFLSDVIIESPHEIDGRTLLVPTSTKMTTNDGVDIGITAVENSKSSNSAEDEIDELEPFSISPVVANNRLSLDLGGFADFFLGRHQVITNVEDTNSIPPPPLFGINKAEKQQQQQLNKAKDINKKTKQCTSTTPKESHQIITPSTAAISELTAEIRSRAMKQEQQQKKKERATSPSDETQDSTESNQDESTTTAAAVTGLAKIASVMEASQTSQQNIHDWDKRFGLRRAHSKTMRESCRSRKKVLEFLKGEIKEGKDSVLSELFAGTPSERSTMPESSTSAAINSGDAMKIEQEEDNSLHSPSPSSLHGDEVIEEDVEMCTTKKVKEDNHGELERMFRRASLDCVENVMGKEYSLLQRGRQTSSESSSGCSDKSVADTLMPMIPQPQETDRKQYHARGA